MVVEQDARVGALEREAAARAARDEERWQTVVTERQNILARLGALEHEVGLVTLSVRVLEARVSIFAGLGALTGGLLVSLIEFYLRGLIK